MGGVSVYEIRYVLAEKQRGVGVLNRVWRRDVGKCNKCIEVGAREQGC